MTIRTFFLVLCAFSFAASLASAESRTQCNTSFPKFEIEQKCFEYRQWDWAERVHPPKNGRCNCQYKLYKAKDCDAGRTPSDPRRQYSRNCPPLPTQELIYNDIPVGSDETDCDLPCERALVNFVQPPSLNFNCCAPSAADNATPPGNQ
jgi:hypothetical protein